MLEMSRNGTIPVCSICMDTFTDPRIISCGHSFCFQCCLSNFYISHHRSCPLCNKRVNLPTISDQLIKNWQLASVLFEIKQAEEHSQQQCSTNEPTVQEKLVNLKTKCSTCNKLFPASDIYSCEDHSCKEICGVCCMRRHKQCNTTNLGDQVRDAYEGHVKTGDHLKEHFERYTTSIDEILTTHSTCLSKLEKLSDELKIGQQLYTSKTNKINGFREGIENAIGEKQTLTCIGEMMRTFGKFNTEELKTYADEANDIKQVHEQFVGLWQKIQEDIEAFRHDLEEAEARNRIEKTKQNEARSSTNETVANGVAKSNTMVRMNKFWSSVADNMDKNNWRQSIRRFSKQK